MGGPCEPCPSRPVWTLISPRGYVRFRRFVGLGGVPAPWTLLGATAPTYAILEGGLFSNATDGLGKPRNRTSDPRGKGRHLLQ